MRELITETQEIKSVKRSEFLYAAVMQIAVSAVTFICSRAVVDFTYMPFGIAFVAGCSKLYIYAAAIGAFAGYFIPAAGSMGFRYIAALLLVLAIRVLISKKEKFSQNPIVLGLIALLSDTVTLIFTVTGNSMQISEMLAESILCGVGAFFICKAFFAFKNITRGLSAEELACFLAVMGIIVMGLGKFSLFGVSIGNTTGLLLILIASKYGGVYAGAVSGITVAFGSLLSGNFEGGIIFCFSGLMAGVFSSYGKYAQSLSLAACCVLAAVDGSYGENSYVLSIQSIIAIVVFLILPRSIGIYLGKIFSMCPKVSTPYSLKKAVTLRLNLASDALCDVSKTVEQVSDKLSKINKPDFQKTVNSIESKACYGCKLRIHCWETKNAQTVDAILKMTDAVKSGENEPENFSGEEFLSRCIRLRNMGSTVLGAYKEYALKTAAQNRIEEVRSVVSDQFAGISEMLKDLSSDLENGEKFDNATAITAASALKNLNIHASECSAVIDKYGRMSLDIRVPKSDGTVLNKMQIMKCLSVACEREFDIPVITLVGNENYIGITEHPVFKVNLGIGQFAASGGEMCGDAYSCFYDGKGHFILILSDGMGTGGRAAVDGAMASGLMSRLLKAGFGYDCSLRILNSSMVFKSTDESLATVDIASIDLFTGQTEFYKAGAAPSIVRRSGRTGKAESTSLPIGIIKDVAFDKAGIRLKDGDILLLMSDGATACGTDWIREETEHFEGEDAKDLAEHIAECARRRRDDNHEDDVTVIAAILERLP
ncbi:MAG: SpoIIE family protein phosphatase [Clostridia bacterium]|nr:SpoIIE family protein phosphatase [Clostridia bacterium]